MLINVGIIGGGVLGAAHANVLRHYANVRVYDTNPARASHSLRDVVHQEVIFVCVPTPMRKNGTVDRTNVEDVLRCLAAESSAKAVVLKSTLPPNDLAELDAIGGPSLIFSPEFLTERSAEYDLQQSQSFIFGENTATPEATEIVCKLFEARWPSVPQFWTSLQTAAIVKYMRNTFFATKVALMNEFDRVLRAQGAERKRAFDLFMLDPRIGRSHFQVPGHDGKPGFGGVCFLKDVPAFIHIARDSKADAKIVEAAWESNVEMRGADTVARELSGMLGRAVSEPMTTKDVEGLG